MTAALIIFGASFVGITAMLLNKLQQLHKGKAFVAVSAEADAKMQEFSRQTLEAVKKTPKVIIQTIAYLTIRYSLVVYEKAKKKIYPRIAHLVDAVKGKDVPKNRGSASFFLSSIKKEIEPLE